MTDWMIERVEVITGVERRRRWSVAEKLRIVEESCVPGVSVSAVARAHGLRPNQLFDWRQLAREGALCHPDGDLLPVSLVSGPVAPPIGTAFAVAEIGFPNGCRLSVSSGIDEVFLRRLASALLAAG